VYALVNEKAIPVESLKSVTASPLGRILITGVAVSISDVQTVRSAVSTLHKKDVVSFNVVTSDWRTLTGKATITDLKVASKPKEMLPFFIGMKLKKERRIRLTRPKVPLLRRRQNER
jgi:hypothetical protein